MCRALPVNCSQQSRSTWQPCTNRGCRAGPGESIKTSISKVLSLRYWYMIWPSISKILRYRYMNLPSWASISKILRYRILLISKKKVRYRRIFDIGSIRYRSTNLRYRSFFISSSVCFDIGSMPTSISKSRYRSTDLPISKLHIVPDIEAKTLTFDIEGLVFDIVHISISGIFASPWYHDHAKLGNLKVQRFQMLRRRVSGSLLLTRCWHWELRECTVPASNRIMTCNVRPESGVWPELLWSPTRMNFNVVKHSLAE